MVSSDQDRLKAMEEAGRTPHKFVPHHKDSECDLCGLASYMAPHIGVQQWLPGLRKGGSA